MGQQETHMQSPFPGMDPYLEGELWQEFHDRLAEQISEQVAAHIRPKYVTALARRFVLTHSLPGMYKPQKASALFAERPADLTQSCPGATEPAVELLSPLPEEIPVVSVEIRDIAERRLVTVIEILAPASKYSDGVRTYHRRRTALLRTSVHLLEIDLLRHGERIELLGDPPPAPYYAYLSRVQRRPYTQVWPISLREPLPVLPVPLLPPDSDVPLDLQHALHTCYRQGGFERMLNYTLPLPHLKGDDALWVADTIARKTRPQ
jgi:hypothetical protein